MTVDSETCVYTHIASRHSELIAINKFNGLAIGCVSNRPIVVEAVSSGLSCSQCNDSTHGS